MITQTNNCGPLSSIPLKTTKEEDFYRHLLYRYESTRNIIENYNYFIDMILPQMFIGEYKIATNLSSGIYETKYVTKVIVEYPSIKQGKDIWRITPDLARKMGVSYMSDIYLIVATPTTIHQDSSSPQYTYKEEYIGSISTCVGSNRCYLSKRPQEFSNDDDWKIYCGECPSMAGGFFINKGMEKVLIHREHLRTCDYFSVETKDKSIITRITCTTKSETSVVLLQTGKKKPTIKVWLQHTRGKHYPLYLVFYMLWKKYQELYVSKNIEFSIEIIDKLIKSFAPEEERNQIQLVLISSRNKFLSKTQVQHSGSTFYDLEKIYQYASSKAKDLSDSGSIEGKGRIKLFVIYDAIFKDLFNSSPNIENKIANLAYMVCQHIQCLLKNRSLNNRDSWANKKIDGPARLVEILLSQAFTEMKIKKKETFNLSSSVDNLITKAFKNGFNSESWGVGRGVKENAAENFKSDSILAVSSQCAKVNTPVSSRIKKFEARKVQPTQFGIICPAETPEDASCGLIKHLSATTNISCNRTYEKDRRHLIEKLLLSRDYFSNPEKKRKCHYLFTCNNTPITSTTGKNLYISSEMITKFNFGDYPLIVKDDIANLEVLEPGIELLISHWSGEVYHINLPVEFADVLYRLFGVINAYFSTSATKQYNYTFAINGEILIYPDTALFYPKIIWVTPDTLVSLFKTQRRHKKLPRDCCIYKNLSNMIVQYYDDGGRPLTPLLTVDKDGDLIADKLKWKEGEKEISLWDFIGTSDYHRSTEYVEKFYDLGAMELIDIKEYDSIFLAESIDQIRAFSYFRKFLEKHLPQEVRLLNQKGIDRDSLEIDDRECANYTGLIRMNYMALFSCTDNIETINDQGIDDSFEHSVEIENFRHIAGILFLKKTFSFFKNEIIFYKIYRYLKTKYIYTHCFINPCSIFSGVANLVPKGNCGQGPRITYQAGMSKQALSTGTFMNYRRFDTTFKRSIAPMRTSFETLAEEPFFLNTFPITETVIMMFGTHCNCYEDAVITSRNFADRMMRDEITSVYKTSETISGKHREKVVRPGVFSSSKIADKFRHIERNGLPRLGSYILPGDCIIGKVQITPEHEEINVSVYADVGDYGEVIAISVINCEEPKENARLFCVKIAHRRFQIVGDKIESRYSQKGTIGRIIGNDGKTPFDFDFVARIIDENEMPIVRGGPNDGLKPDLIFNPAGFPSRMTCGKIFEIQSSKAALEIQERVNGSMFSELDLQKYSSILEEHGMDRFGNEFMSHSDGEVMMDSSTGKPFKAFVGPCSYQILRHHVFDKIQSRGIGRNDALTRQPVGGRKVKQGSAIRIGEMERDAFISHGASDILLERLMKSSDEYRTTYCTHCNQLSSDAPLINNVCSVCKAIDTLVTVTTPRVFLIFTQILGGLGINVNTFLKDS
jgi:DNA-directed RNA polymerase beta subunit